MHFRLFIAWGLACAGAGLRGAPATGADLDWPHARGPRLDGVFQRSSPIAPWTAQGLNQLWQQPLGQGFSGVVVAAGRVFTQHQTSAGQELICLDLETGAVRWRTRYAFPWEMDGRYPGPYGTPTVAQGRVYFSDCYGVVGCANAADGAIRWQFDAVKKLAPGGVDFGYAAAPLVLGDRLYAPAPAGDGKITAFCLDATTGGPIWQTGATFPSYASAMPISIGAKDCLLLPLRNGVAIYDRASGAELWKEEWSRGYDEHSCWPVYQEPLLFFPSAFRRAARVYRLALSDGRVMAEAVWEERVLCNDVFSSALHEGHLYGFDVQSQQSELLGRTRGTLKCVELASGAVRWSQAGIKHCSVTLVGTRLLLLEDEGDLVLVEPEPQRYRELARATLPQKGKFWATPVVIGNRLLIRGSDSVACYALAPIPHPSSTIASAAPTPRSPATARPRETGFSEKVRGWFERHRTPDFIAPPAHVLLRWYGAAVALLVLALAIFGGGWVWAAAAFGILGTGVLTSVLEQFWFVAPLSLFALFCAAAPAIRNPVNAGQRHERRLASALRLAGFVALCFAYYRGCGGLFLVSGWGFLVGFPAVVLLAWAWQRNGAHAWKQTRLAATVWPLAAFTAYFWSSALAIL